MAEFSILNNIQNTRYRDSGCPFLKNRKINGIMNIEHGTRNFKL